MTTLAPPFRLVLPHALPQCHYTALHLPRHSTAQPSVFLLGILSRNRCSLRCLPTVRDKAYRAFSRSTQRAPIHSTTPARSSARGEAPPSIGESRRMFSPCRLDNSRRSQSTSDNARVASFRYPNRSCRTHQELVAKVAPVRLPEAA